MTWACSATAAETNGSKAWTSIPKARAREATSRPMRPSPTTPRRLPNSSTPANFLRSQVSAFMEESAGGMLRARASIRAIASSAVEIVLPPGEFMTSTPRRVAAARSMLSTPDAAPAR